MKHLSASLFAMAALLAMAVPANAQLRPAEKDKSDTEMAGDVATQPLEDLNIRSGEIPPLLMEALKDPYSTEGIRKCGEIIAAVRELDAVLGPDFDVVEEQSREDKRRDRVGGIGKSIIGGLIPFRGIVREVTGAASKRRRLQQAIYAGVTRRAFLKGIGQQRRCKVPGRPAENRPVWQDDKDEED
ncbi:MAG: hypothetical protein R3E02_10190 [Blastomonas sp.]